MAEIDQKRHTLGFKREASPPKDGIALICDLKGFSAFLNQPDVQHYVPAFLNHVFEALSIIFFGGEAYWLKTKPTLRGLPAPVHEKFLGDGALYIWSLPTPKLDELARLMCNSLWNLQEWFEKRVLARCHEDVPVISLPKQIRFGLARGTVYELQKSETGEKEYIGFCINLASRLQKYCPELAFIASARIGLRDEYLKKNFYTKVVATSLRGFPEEIVIVDQREFAALDETTRSGLFRKL